MRDTSARSRIGLAAFRGVGIGIAVGTVCIAFLIATAVFPLALHRFGGIGWPELSDIGQAYGGLAAALAALSLSAVAISVFLQARHTRIAEEHGSRLLQLELVRMGLDEPVVLRKLGDWSRELTEDEIRYHVHKNLWLMLWKTHYRLGVINEMELRSAVRTELFNDAFGKRLWRRSRDEHLAFVSSQGRRNRRFYNIVEHEYQESLTRENRRTSTARSIPRIRANKRYLLAAGGAIGMVSAYAISQLRDRHGTASQ